MPSIEETTMQDAGAAARATRAAFYRRLGPARDVFEVGEIDLGELAHGEVRVRVAASAVNPSDVKARTGSRGFPFPQVVPHSDGAGEIVAVGGDVDPARVGERVWVFEGQWERPFGTAAELVDVPAGHAVALPDGVELDVGACMGIPAMTAHRAVLADGPVDGHSLVVRAGAGRVGFYAAQIARLAGATTVITTAGSDDTAARAGRTGAQVVTGHAGDELHDVVMDATDGRGVDRIVDVEFGAHLDHSLGLLAVNGTIASYGSTQVPQPVVDFYRMMRRNIALRTVFVYNMPEAAKQAAITDITRWLTEGALVHQFGPSFDLDEIADAHEAIESGVHGVVLVRP
jgi:NADPH:quinone reductase